MCGIAGVISFEGEAKRFDLDVIQHRGPDSKGEWYSPDRRMWLGMTRLAILDLSPTGEQPMTDHETGNVIVFNGEIYNHPALREELERLGARFSGTSDTETLLAGYKYWGEKMLPQLKGMFTIAIYNRGDRSVFLARDRFGIKPLYVYSGSNEIVFASEVRGIVSRHQLRPSKESIAAYLQWGSCPHELGLFPDIKEMPVGAHLRINSDGLGQPAIFWPPQNGFATKKRNAQSRPAIVRRTRELLEKSIHEHILSDVPVACFLSGGVDSSTITALAAQELKRDLHTFSVGFDQASHDESAYAKRIATQYGTDHVEIRLSAEQVIETTKEAVVSMDLPSVDAINTYIVAKEVAARGFKVALAGVGGDELFGGYPQFRFLSRLKYLAALPGSLRRLPIRLGKGRHLLSDVPQRMDTLQFAHWWRRVWNGALLSEFNLPVRDLTYDSAPLLPDEFSRISWSELRHYMRDVLLRDSDQMSMAVSLEVRVPFLDHELVEFILTLPAAAKERGQFVKSLLIESVQDLLPSEIYARKKMGFQLPMDDWMRGPLEKFTAEGLTAVIEHAILEEEQAHNLQHQFQGRRLHWQPLWAIVVLGWYLKKLNLIMQTSRRDAVLVQSDRYRP